MDIVRTKWYEYGTNTEHIVDFTSNDFAHQTCMWTDTELLAATVEKCRKYARKHPTHKILSVEIIAR